MNIISDFCLPLQRYSNSLNFDVVYEMASSGPVTLDLNFRNTSGNDKIGYFYYTGTLDINNVKKYILIDNAAESSLIKKNEYQTWISGYSGSWSDAMQQMNIQYDNENTIYRGTRYNLVYFGSDGTSEGTYTFPQGTKIGFFIIQDNYYSSNNLVKYSIPSLNSSSENGQEYVSTFNYGGTTFLGFEDWRNGDYDLNDVMFFATGNFTPPTEIGPDPESEETPQWIIAYEDLGDTDDYDFNDIVFGISHLAGTNVATITPMAAGGVYEAYIYYMNEPIGEIHQLLGHSAKADGSYSMVNTGGTKATKQEKVLITVPADYSLSNGMGDLSIQVFIPDMENQKAVRIYGISSGTAPQMFLVEGTWKWPKERKGIELAYPDFRYWNGDASNTSWCNSYDSDEIVWDKK